jgi:hypothetical protein
MVIILISARVVVALTGRSCHLRACFQLILETTEHSHEPSTLHIPHCSLRLRECDLRATRSLMPSDVRMYAHVHVSACAD